MHQSCPPTPLVLTQTANCHAPWPTPGQSIHIPWDHGVVDLSFRASIDQLINDPVPGRGWKASQVTSDVHSKGSIPPPHPLPFTPATPRLSCHLFPAVTNQTTVYRVPLPHRSCLKHFPLMPKIAIGHSIDPSTTRLEPNIPRPLPSCTDAVPLAVIHERPKLESKGKSSTA